LKLKAEFQRQVSAMAGQFVNVRLKVDTLAQALWCRRHRCSAARGHLQLRDRRGRHRHAKPVAVTQQNETEAVIASGLQPSIAW